MQPRWADRERPIIVFNCHRGRRSRDAAASYFAGHGITNVHSMTGAIDAWSIEVDSSVPCYEVAPEGLSAAG